MIDSAPNAMADLGARIKDSRTQRGLTQAQLAELVSRETGTKVHQGTIARTESGERSPSLVEAAALSTVLGLRSRDIFNLVLPRDIDASRDQYERRLRDVFVQLDILREAATLAARENRRFSLEKKRRGLPPSEVVGGQVEDLDVDLELLNAIRETTVGMGDEINAIHNRYMMSQGEKMVADMMDGSFKSPELDDGDD